MSRKGEKTVGSEILRKLGHKHTQAVIARKCGVSQPEIARWMWGRRKPNYENRRELCFAYGIEMDAWDRPAQSEKGPQHE